MKRKKKGIWALFLTAALVTAQASGAAAALEIKTNNNGNGDKYTTQPGVSANIIDAAEMRNLVANSSKKQIIISRSQRTVVTPGAWDQLEGIQFISRTITVDGKLQIQLTFPLEMESERDLCVSGNTNGSEAVYVRQLFNRHYENVKGVIHFDEREDWGKPVRVAVRPPNESNVNAYQFYSYNSEKNTYKVIPQSNPQKDKNGWLHFTTPYAGDIIISQGALLQRDTPLPNTESRIEINRSESRILLPPYVDPDPDPDPVPSTDPNPNPKPNPEPDPGPGPGPDDGDDTKQPSISIEEQKESLIANQKGEITFTVYTENIEDGKNLIVNPEEGTPEGLSFSIDPVQNSETILTVNSDNSVDAGEYRFIVSYGTVTAEGAVPVVSQTIEKPTITQVTMFEDYVGLLVELSSPIELDITNFQVSDGNESLTLDRVTTRDKQTYTVNFQNFDQEKQYTLRINLSNDGEPLETKIDNKPAISTTVKTQEELQRLLAGGLTEISLTGSTAYKLGGAIGDKVTFYIAENAELILTSPLTSSGIKIRVESGGTLIGYENIGAGNTVDATSEGIITDKDGNTIDQVSITIGQQTGTLTAGTAGSVTFDITTENIADHTTLTVTSAKDNPDGLRFSIELVQDNKAALTVESDGSVSAGDYPFTVSYNNFSVDGNVSVSTTEPPETIEIISVEPIGNYGFTVVLSAPTEKALELDRFSVTTLGPSNLSLGSVETSDNQTYKVFTDEKRGALLPYNNYSVTVTLPDGKVLNGQFYVDKYPSIGSITASRKADGTVTATFTSNMAGTIYYGTCTTKADKPSDVNDVIQNGKQAELKNGDNILELDSVQEDHGYFYLVAVNEKGMAPTFVDGAEITSAEPPPVSKIEVGGQQGELTEGTAGTVTFDVITENVAEGRQPVLIWENSPSGNISCSVSDIENSTATITIKTDTNVPAGSYKFTVTVDGITSDPATLVIDEPIVVKTVSIGEQQGELTEGTTGMVTFEVTTENIENGAASAITWENGFPEGITPSIPTLRSNKATITFTGDTNTVAGNYNFTVTADGVESDPATLVIDEPIVVKTVNISEQKSDLITEIAENVSLDDNTENTSDELDPSVE